MICVVYVCVRTCLYVGVNWNDGMQYVYVVYVDKEGKWKVCLTGSESVKK